MNDSVLDLITRERVRQIYKFGFDERHDDTHVNGELADAAACYAATKDDLAYFDEVQADPYHCPHASLWPFDWEERWNQRSTDDRITQLVKAGALIVAEIERLQRLQNEATEEAST